VRRRIDVAEAVTDVRSEFILSTPKTHQRRSVPLPRSLVDPLAEHIAGKGPDDLVFTPPGARRVARPIGGAEDGREEPSDLKNVR
jgi:hypothetical protein